MNKSFGLEHFLGFIVKCVLVSSDLGDIKMPFIIKQANSNVISTNN